MTDEAIRHLLPYLEPDGALHFSTLKHVDDSPMHLRHAVVHGIKVTKPMRVGTIVHRIVLGPQQGHDVVIYPDKRMGKMWQLFEKAHANDTIVTQAEWEEAEPIAEAVLRDPKVVELLLGSRREVPIRWSNNGIPCSTRGIDVVNDALRIIADLKTTRCSKPRAFMRQAVGMHYHAQLAHYEDGALANGIDCSGGVKIIAVETKPPYPVTIFNLPQAVREAGRNKLAMWISTLKGCAEINHWPAYAQSEVEFELPLWMGSDLDEDNDEEAA